MWKGSVDKTFFAALNKLGWMSGIIFHNQKIPSKKKVEDIILQESGQVAKRDVILGDGFIFFNRGVADRFINLRNKLVHSEKYNYESYVDFIKDNI